MVTVWLLLIRVQAWDGLWEFVVKDYISDIYPDVIETFIGATVKVGLSAGATK